MDELIKTFHIDWKLLIAQIVNFGIVLLVLHRFAIKPLSKTMDRRTAEIAKSLEDAKKIEENLAKIEAEKAAKMLVAKKEAQEIIEQARQQGEVQGSQLIVEAKNEVQTVIAAAKEQIAGEKSKMLKEIKTEVADLVTLATEKILAKVGRPEIDEKIVETALKEIKK